MLVIDSAHVTHRGYLGDMGNLSFLDMKRKDSAAELNAINKRIDELGAPGDYEKDARYWRPVIDKSNSGSAIIRFLQQPPMDGEDGLPFVRKWTHGFKSPKTGKWYIENSLTTLKMQDPVSDLNRILWGPDKECNPTYKKQVGAQKRKLRYISNILVLKHDARPEDVGNVFLYAYGQSIFDKIKDAGNPPETDIEGFNAFNFFSGANFRLRIRDKDNWVNYETSVFDAPSVIGPLGGDRYSDEEIERIWNLQHSLAAEIAPDKFKTYEQLQKKLDEVLGTNSVGHGDVDPDAMYRQQTSTGTKTAEKTAEPELRSVASGSIAPGQGDDPDLEAAFFERIAARAKGKGGEA